MAYNIPLGERVMYSRNWLRSTGQFTGDAAFVVGTVTGALPLVGSWRVLTVRWDDGRTTSVLDCNLIARDRVRLEVQ